MQPFQRSNSAGRVQTVLTLNAEAARRAQAEANERIETILKGFQAQVTTLTTKVGQLEAELATTKSLHTREVALLKAQIKEQRSQVDVRVTGLQETVTELKETIASVAAQINGAITNLGHLFNAHSHEYEVIGPAGHSRWRTLGPS